MRPEVACARRARFAALALSACLALLCLGVVPTTSSAARPLRLGFVDQAQFSSPSKATRDHWLSRAAADRADLVLSIVNWRDVAPSRRPAGFTPTDPRDPAYSWGTLDDTIRSAKARGMEVILTITSAPRWAEGRGRPKRAPAGTWKPRPADVRDFSKAIAQRYSGGLVDPTSPLAGPLPRVRYFQIWTEPNLSSHLTPQWKGGDPVAASHYRKMLNAAYGAVHRVARGNKVVTAGTAPYGDGPGSDRIRPLRFWREVLCLRDRRKLKPTKCRTKAKLDVLAHHPINTSGPPQQSAVNPDDVSSPDMGSLRRTLRRAERLGTLKPRGRHPLWATEFWWSSNPPDRAGGVRPRTQARYISQSLYLLWRAGVEAAINLRIRDAASIDGSTVAQLGTGLYYANGSPKPSARAFRFPFIGDRRGGQIKLWGKAPGAGRVFVERKGRTGWRTIKALRAGETRTFTGRTKLRGRAVIRARAGGERSLPWRVPR